MRQFQLPRLFLVHQRPSPAHHLKFAPTAPSSIEDALEKAHLTYENARRELNNRRIASFRSRSGLAYLRDFYFVTSLGSRLSEKRECKLCDFLRLHAADPDKRSYKLLAICSSDSCVFEALRRDSKGRWKSRKWDDMEYNVFLAVVPEVEGIPKTGLPLRWLETDLMKQGCIYRLTEQAEEEDGKRIALPGDMGPTIDPLLAGYWRYICRTSHLACCAPKKPPGATLRGFRVINCVKNPIRVEDIPWGEKYVALSYVWGDSTEKWPQTLKDAVMLTKMMGERYLWVDRLCIDQSEPDEKMYLISKMDAIYAGAEFTIVNAAGDARTGLPGVWKTPRKVQPRVELELPKGKQPAWAAEFPDDPYMECFNVSESEYMNEVEGHSEWLDIYRHGLKSTMKIVLDEMTDLESISEECRARKYDIPVEQVEYHESSAKELGLSFDVYMERAHEFASRIGIPFSELMPHLMMESARKASHPFAQGEPLPPIMPKRSTTTTNPSKPAKPLPPGKVPGKLILVSTMQDPRVSIRNSKWATRGWTYQEGVLSNRCLVFTEEQMYWECRGMAVSESLTLPIPAFHVPSKRNDYWHFADYMLSGILEGDMHRVPEFQYGFQSGDAGDVSDQVERLDGHIRSFTSRELTNAEDAWNAFMGIASTYANPDGLAMILGIPVWAGTFSYGNPGLKHSFAMSMSVWSHVGKRIEPRSEMYCADCVRLSKFPSWTWIGWQGRVDFNGDNTDHDPDDSDDLGDDDYGGDRAHTDFFMAQLAPGWTGSINRIWSADLTLSSDDGKESTILSGSIPMDFIDPRKKWLLTIKDALVLKHLYLMHSSNQREWRRLMGKLVELRLSVPYTEHELTDAHKSGEMVTVLIYASTTPFVWDGRARFLILRRVDNSGERWERIGRLVLSMEEHLMAKYKSDRAMIDDLPVKKFGRDLVLV
ncbi:hypothetical protein jhhlp_004827 [Lomentospora prolificans]|uniref:Heterokaryon incompatibility domain-containing protein n=1 Tax=Lomentospora prolificans TaxID=41688 RepID=A0A2N3N8N7_9PEZI|nr:hypothetical protein jhhlp_004827 [Lomentospora prolificans]